MANEQEFDNNYLNLSNLPCNAIETYNILKTNIYDNEEFAFNAIFELIFHIISDRNSHYEMIIVDEQEYQDIKNIIMILS